MKEVNEKDLDFYGPALMVLCENEEELDKLEKMNGEEVLQNIHKKYNDNYKEIISICNFDELEILKELVQDGNEIYEFYVLINDIGNEINSLQRKGLIDLSGNTYSIPDCIFESVKKAVKGYKVKEEKKLGKILNVLEGMLCIYGRIDVVECLDVLNKYVKVSKEDFLKIASEKKYIRTFMLVMPTDNLSMEFCYIPYFEQIDKIKELQNKNKTSVCIRDIDEVILYGKNMFDFESPYIEELYFNIEDDDVIESIIWELRMNITLCTDFDKIIKNLIKKKVISKNDKEVIDIIENIYKSIPTPALNGMTIYEYEERQK